MDTKTRVQRNAEWQALNGLERTALNWVKEFLDKHPDSLEYELGNVGIEEVQFTKENHRKAKYAEADLKLLFNHHVVQKLDIGKTLKNTAIVEVQLSFKQRLTVIPKRVWKETLGLKYLKQEDFLIVDTMEFEGLVNSDHIKVVVYEDKLFGGFYVYDYEDLLRTQKYEIYLEDEGEGVGLKRKNLITKDTTNFKTYNEAMEYIIEHYNVRATLKKKLAIIKKYNKIGVQKEYTKAPVSEAKVDGKPSTINKGVVICRIV